MKFVATGVRPAHIPCPMMVQDADSDEDVRRRVVLLRETYKPGLNQRQFAAWLDVTYQRWNNVENGAPLGRDLAALLVRKIPGLTLDWLYLGRIAGMHLELLQRLSEAEEKATKTGRGPSS